ncbi:MAG: hypothetical protein PWR08_1708 [Thermoanaerobacterium sp.]|nr:hypothetical protein [Thermoanaerobacterium sp.]
MRIEGKYKMGYYPTPNSIVDRIKSFLDFPTQYNVLDPCCGEGDAISNLIDNNGRTYGVELDYQRYSKACEKLTRTLYGGYEEMITQNNAFSILFLNPPYDTDENGERKELIFLKKTIKYLTTGGILIYIIPQHIIHDTARLLSYAFADIKVYRFTDEEYNAYKQVVIFGIKKRNKKVIASDVEKLLKAEKANTNLEEIPLLSEPVYKVPVTIPPKYFNNGYIDENYLQKKLSESNLLFNVKKQFETVKEKEEKRPPLPLHMAHIGLLLATGSLNGEMDGHVVKGVVKKSEKKSIEEDEETGETTEKKTEELSVSIKILTKYGEIKELI